MLFHVKNKLSTLLFEVFVIVRKNNYGVLCLLIRIHDFTIEVHIFVRSHFKIVLTLTVHVCNDNISTISVSHQFTESLIHHSLSHK